MERSELHVDVGGKRTYTLRGGAGAPLLYLHSAMGEVQWLPHLAALAERYELHVPAHPGFLSSEGIEQVDDVEDLVWHYLDYMDAMGWRSVAIVGHSLGGWIAAEIAARYPERVSRLVLVASVGIWVPERPITDIFALDTRFPDRLAGMLFHDTSHPLAQLMSVPLTDMSDEQLAAAFHGFAATAKIGWNPLLHDPRLERILRRVTAPTLLVWGGDDKVVPPVYGEKFQRLIPDARLHVIDGCGHMVPFEKESEFLAVVTRFLG
ncbi:MAG TPA: alpha/beta fold hydrolase [Candidatus Limnocylindrales bacterium]|nr:alpha/beta fold hydrolase [Candidatus Limnocylindrales bacterium]